MALTKRDVITMIQGKAELSTAELGRLGISRQYISLLKQAGVLIRLGHARYRLSDRYDQLQAAEVSRPTRISVDLDNRSQ